MSGALRKFNEKLAAAIAANAGQAFLPLIENYARDNECLRDGYRGRAGQHRSGRYAAAARAAGTTGKLVE